jgi:hypothetical protein
MTVTHAAQSETRGIGAQMFVSEQKQVRIRSSIPPRAGAS